MTTRLLTVALMTVSLLTLSACDKSGKGQGKSGDGSTIVVDGSDTMVNMIQAWAESYHKVKPGVEIQVSGGGSGVGINSLIAGKVDMASSSRKMDEKEIAKCKQNNNGKEPKEFIVGLDALAVYVHNSNPLEAISVEELAEIYGDGGTVTKWTQVGPPNPSCPGDEITRISRQNNSGTYAYFREAVLGKKRDFKNGSIDQSGSKDVVALVGKSPCAIGYSGMGYKDSSVKWLKISAKKGQPAIPPSEDPARSGAYPIARPLFIYTLGEPTGALKEFLDWAVSPEGQKIVAEVGFVTLKKQ